MAAGASPASLGGQLRAFPGRAVLPGQLLAVFRDGNQENRPILPPLHLFLHRGITSRSVADDPAPPHPRETPTLFIPSESFGERMGE